MLQTPHVKNGIDINRQWGRKKRTALIVAVERGHEEIFDLILENFKDVDILDKKTYFNDTAVDVAAYNGYVAIFCKLLLTLIKRKNVTTMEGLKTNGILDDEHVTKWISFCEEAHNSQFLAFIRNLKVNAVDTNSFSYLITLLNGSKDGGKLRFFFLIFLSCKQKK